MRRAALAGRAAARMGHARSRRFGGTDLLQRQRAADRRVGGPFENMGAQLLREVAERVLGDATRGMFASMTVPVLMTH